MPQLLRRLDGKRYLSGISLVVFERGDARQRFVVHDGGGSVVADSGMDVERLR